MIVIITERYVHIQISGAYKYNLIWEESFYKCKLRILRISWIIQVHPKFNGKSPYKREREDTEHRGEDHVNAEADIRVI